MNKTNGTDSGTRQRSRRSRKFSAMLRWALARRRRRRLGLTPSSSCLPPNIHRRNATGSGTQLASYSELSGGSQTLTNRVLQHTAVSCGFRLSWNIPNNCTGADSTRRCDNLARKASQCAVCSLSYRFVIGIAIKLSVMMVWIWRKFIIHWHGQDVNSNTTWRLCMVTGAAATVFRRSIACEYGAVRDSSSADACELLPSGYRILVRGFTRNGRCSNGYAQELP